MRTKPRKPRIKRRYKNRTGVWEVTSRVIPWEDESGDGGEIVSSESYPLGFAVSPRGRKKLKRLVDKSRKAAWAAFEIHDARMRRISGESFDFPQE